MEKISVVMIVKNEEKVLERCLKSLRGFDEIVILDTGSTDNTNEIAKKYTDKYISNIYQWNDNFSEARNKAQEYATGDWIFVIDADEFLEPEGLQKIKTRLSKSTIIKAFNIVCLHERTGMKHVQPRLYRNSKEIFWKGAIHNYLSVLGEEELNVVVFYGYSPTHSQDPDRALRILKREVEKNQKCVREKYYLAREYWYRKDYITAIWWCKEYLRVAYWGPEIADAWLILARCYWNVQRGEDARNCCLQAIKLNTNFKEALEFIAEISGPGNKKRWFEFAKTATNEGILFVRTKKNSQTVILENSWKVYYCEGMKFYGERIEKLFGFKKYDGSTGPVLFEGLYFEDDFITFKNHQGQKTVFWNGSDVYRLLKNPFWISIVKGTKAKHICHNEELKEKLKNVGIEASICPIFFGDAANYPISFQPSKEVEVYLTAHPNRETEYGLDTILEISVLISEVKFHVYGINAQPWFNHPENIIYHGLVDEEVMDKEIKNYQGCLKLNKFGGFSQTVMKSILLGQYPISATPIDGVWYAKDKTEIISYLKLLSNQREPNYDLRNKYLDIFKKEKYLEAITK